jgi:hypothetical protein
MMAARCLSGREGTSRDGDVAIGRSVGSSKDDDAVRGFGDLQGAPHTSAQYQEETATTSLSAAATAEPRVVACEVFPPMARLARRIVSQNGLSSKVRVVLKRSDELKIAQPCLTPDTGPTSDAASDEGAGVKLSAAARRRAAMAASAAAGHGGDNAAEDSLPAQCDVIVTEIFDSQLLGEGLLPTLRDAVPRLLKVCFA